MQSGSERRIHLLLSRGGAEESEALAQGLPFSALDNAVSKEQAEQLQKRSAQIVNYGDLDAAASDLKKKRWGLVVPGDPAQRSALLGAVAPLIALRAEQIGCRPDELLARNVYTADFARCADPIDAERWFHEVYREEAQPVELRRPVRERPDYLLILGDLHQVPESIHRVLSRMGYFVGRLAFSKEDGSPDLPRYESYASRLVAVERAASPAPAEGASGRVRILGVADGSSATELGLDQLVSPMLTRLTRDPEDPVGKALLRPDAVRIYGRDELWSEAEKLRDSVLFTMSHGHGGPDSGWARPVEQRAGQGAMSFLRRSPRLTAADAAAMRRPFVQNGIWFMFACYGAGTPAESHYYPWLAQLQEEYGADFAWVLRSIPAQGGDSRPFIASLPQTLLSKEDGPLAFIGHLDLAWSYGFQTARGQADTEAFEGFIESVVERQRVGAAFQRLNQKLRGAEGRVLNLYNLRQQLARAGGVGPAGAAAGLSKEQQTALNEGWMMSQDMSGYVLLGDPAVRLSPAAVATVEPRPPELVTAASAGSATEKPPASFKTNNEQDVHFSAGPATVTAAPVAPIAPVVAAPSVAAVVPVEPAAPAAPVEPRAPAAPPAPGTAPAPSLSAASSAHPSAGARTGPDAQLDRFEEALAHVLIGELGVAEIARRYGVERRTLERLAERYRAAGRDAVGLK